METGERGGDRPSNSYRNILRAGFEEIAVTANWAGQALAFVDSTKPRTSAAGSE